MSLSENIRKFRTEKNMTQEQLANLLGVSSQAVSPTAKSLSIDVLLSLSTSMPPIK